MATLGGYLNSEQPPPSAMASAALQQLTPNSPVLEKVLIVTADSRILVGTLAAADQSTNLVRAPSPSLPCPSPEPLPCARAWA